MEILRRYLKAQHGRTKALAERIGVTSGSISQWRAVPPHHVLAVEEFSGLSRYDLRPDIFGPRPAKKQRAA